MRPREIDYASLAPGDYLPEELPTLTARAAICGEPTVELDALLGSGFCEELARSFRDPDEPLHVRVNRFAKAYDVASSCRLASIDPPPSVTDILADPPTDDGYGWTALDRVQVASARLGLSPAPERTESPFTSRSWTLFEMLPIWSAAGLPFGGAPRLAQLFLGMGWREPSPADTGSPSLAVPFVTEALTELDAAAVRSIEEGSKSAQLLTADSKLTRKGALVDVHPYAGPFRDSPQSIAAVVLSVGHHVSLQYELAARSDRSAKAWRDRISDPARGVLITIEDVDPGLADPGWDPLVEPLLESIRRAMADLARSPVPRIRWRVGREMVWDTDSPRWLKTEKAALT